jgi:cyclopropane fatty-acyl-phospholipid synthase-like methyltransferase
VRDDASLHVLECTACGLVFLSSIQHIPRRHYENSGMHGATPQAIKDWLRESERDDKRRYRQAFALLWGKKLLDFGCGAGGFLMLAQAAAAEVCGLEPERRLQPYFESNGLKVFQRVEDLSGRLFDLITAFHVVEHLPDPRAVLRQLAGLLTENGTIMVEVPSADDALLTLYQSQAFSEFTYWSQHLFLFNNRTMPTLVEQAGLRLMWLKQVQRYPLSNHLYWLARNAPGGHEVWSFLDSPQLHATYENQLATLGRCDTLLAGIGRR